MTPPQAPGPGLDASLQKLYRRNLHAVRLGLEPTRALLDALGRPQDSFLSIHVAGTNGKGSVSALAASALQACGLRTGLYTSPHLMDFAERIRVNGRPIPAVVLAGLLDVVEAKAQEAMPASGRDVTFFEFTTALAFEHFRREGVQVAVVEVGLGGRLDATNVLDPLAAAITSIGLDHTAHLGETLELIAAEKAGIIKPGRAVICGALPSAALAVVRRRAAEVGSPVILAAEAVAIRRKSQSLEGQRIAIETSDSPYGPLNLPLLGSHQLGNAAVAVALLEHLRDAFRLPVTRTGIESGLSGVRWPARFQLLSRDPPMVLDGAHNPEAARILRAALDETPVPGGLALVVGFLGDKDAAGFMRELAGRARCCWAVHLESSRAMPMDEVLLACRTAGVEAVPSTLGQALTEARCWAAQHGGAVCITGSLYLAGEVLRHLGLPP